MRWDALPPLAALLAYALAFGVSALGVSLLVFDDHPGQLFRVWHVAERGLVPWAWNPGWWAGYPELQFYPPAFAWAGALLFHASLGALTVPAAYKALVWIAYLAPGVTTFVALTRMLGNGWAALPGAFVALTLSAGVASGVEGGVRWGMLAARLGWALLPLLVMSLLSWTETDVDDDPPRPWMAVPLLAAIVLTHPTHLPTALAAVGMAVLAGRGGTGARIVTGTSALALAGAVTAVWTLPLVARVAYMRPLAWGTHVPELTEVVRMMPFVILLVLLALLASTDVGRPAQLSARMAPPRVATALVAGLPWVALALVLVDAFAVEPLGIRWLPANRILDGAWLALLLAAGVTAGSVLLNAHARWRIPLPLGALGAVGIAVLVSLPGGMLALWPERAEWPKYEATARGLRLAELWRTLRDAPPGRVLFVRSAVPLVHGTEWYRAHTHVTALTPVIAGRAIVHGTFTHASPIAALVYRGDAGPGAIEHLAEELDGISLFGRSLAELDAATLNRLVAPLAVSAVVALDDDAPSLRALDGNGEFPRKIATPPFVVYLRRTGIDTPVEDAERRWRVGLAGEMGAWTSARLAYYPLWRASHHGEPVETRRAETGDLEVRLPRANAVIELEYGAGVPERAGAAVSALGILTWLVWGARGRRESWRRGGARRA